MLPVFRLIRFINLLIIVITMLGVVDYLVVFTSNFQEHFNLWILILTTVFIAAGGNVINDYFDIRADRINRPESVVIGKYIKRRWAIVLHWIFNCIGIIGGIYFLFVLGTWVILIIHTISTATLWWYSVWLKKIPLIGNIVIASLIVLVIFMTVYYIPFGFKNYDFRAIDHHFGHLYLRKLDVIFWFAFIGFLLNLAREIVKDAEDIKGDQVIHAKTIPMIIGIPSTIRLVSLIMLVYPVIFISGITLKFESIQLQKIWPLTIASLICCMAIIPLIFPSDKWIPPIKQALKLAMVLGVLYLFLKA